MDSCPLIEMMRQVLDQDKPGWTDELFWCRLHREYHRVIRDPGQLPILPKSDGVLPIKEGGPPRRFGGRVLDDGSICFHKGEASQGDILRAQCAYCGTWLHVHARSLGAVKSGRHGKAYLEEKCPACHRVNAVYPDYAGKGITTAEISAATGMPLIKLRLFR